MQTKGHKELQVNKAGFIVHPTKGWLGASPDVGSLILHMFFLMGC